MDYHGRSLHQSTVLISIHVSVMTDVSTERVIHPHQLHSWAEIRNLLPLYSNDAVVNHRSTCSNEQYLSFVNHRSMLQHGAPCFTKRYNSSPTSMMSSYYVPYLQNNGYGPCTLPHPPLHLYSDKRQPIRQHHHSSGLKYTTTSAVLGSLYRDQHIYLISTTSDRDISYLVLPGFISRVWWVM